MWLERTKNAATVMLIFIVLEAVAIMVVFSGPSAAHEAPPVMVDVTLIAEDRLAVQLALDPRRVLAGLDDVDHDVYATMTLAEAIRRLELQPEGLIQTIALETRDGPLNAALKNIDASGRLDVVFFDTPAGAELLFRPTEALGPALVRVFEPSSDTPTQTTFAAVGETVALPFGVASPQSALSVAVDYVIAGFDHILPKGLDHILFVVGLFLLSPAIRPLLIQVSLFTVAHTATLGLAAVGLVSVPGVIVEPLIAASIAFVAVENVFRRSLSRWRPWIVFGFGLLHGLGFASVLSEFGLPADQFVVALAGFNIGVEIGQLTVIALCFIVFGLASRRTWYRSAVSIPASLVLAGIGLFWFVERIAAGVV